MRKGIGWLHATNLARRSLDRPVPALQRWQRHESPEDDRAALVLQRPVCVRMFRRAAQRGKSSTPSVERGAIPTNPAEHSGFHDVANW